MFVDFVTAIIIHVLWTVGLAAREKDTMLNQAVTLIYLV